ncbi:hypothetical protein [Clostridium sp.]|uniref:hypothetical protein n=1 Tax=Clostridium sp. TaxID=1506 RepID=UPI0032167DB7
MKKLNKLVSAIALLGVLSVPTIANASGYSPNGYQVNSGSSIGYTLEAWANTYADRRVERVDSFAYGNGYLAGKDSGINWSEINVRNIYQNGKVYNQAKDFKGFEILDYKAF